MILAARSRYFNSMFLSGMTECNQEEIEIKGMKTCKKWFRNLHAQIVTWMIFVRYFQSGIYCWFMTTADYTSCLNEHSPVIDKVSARRYYREVTTWFHTRSQPRDNVDTDRLHIHGSGHYRCVQCTGAGVGSWSLVFYQHEVWLQQLSSFKYSLFRQSCLIVKGISW